MHKRGQNAVTLSSNNGTYPTPEAVVRQMLAAWNSHDARKLAALYAEDFVGHDVGRKNPERGRRSIIRAMLYDIAGFPDLRLELVDAVTQADKIAFMWRVQGTHLGRVMNIPPTGRRVNLLGTTFLKIVDGQIVESTRIWDVAGMLRSIGLLPDLQDETDPSDTKSTTPAS
jgi:steroid delta-isomerase-like uncharacterized protein